MGYQLSTTMVADGLLYYFELTMTITLRQKVHSIAQIKQLTEIVFRTSLI